MFMLLKAIICLLCYTNLSRFGTSLTNAPLPLTLGKRSLPSAH